MSGSLHEFSILIFIRENVQQLLISFRFRRPIMEEYDIMEQKYEIFKTPNGSWVECSGCRAIMYDSYGNCWSCGSAMTEENKVPVDL